MQRIALGETFSGLKKDFVVDEVSVPEMPVITNHYEQYPSSGIVTPWVIPPESGVEFGPSAVAAMPPPPVRLPWAVTDVKSVVEGILKGRLKASEVPKSIREGPV
jgi:hypothetical protein